MCLEMPYEVNSSYLTLLLYSTQGQVMRVVDNLWLLLVAASEIFELIPSLSAKVHRVPVTTFPIFTVFG